METSEDTDFRTTKSRQHCANGLLSKERKKKERTIKALQWKRFKETI